MLSPRPLCRVLSPPGSHRLGGPLGESVGRRLQWFGVVREACEADSERLLRTRSILFTHWCGSWFRWAASYVAKMPELEEVTFRSEESTYWADGACALQAFARCPRLVKVSFHYLRLLGLPEIVMYPSLRTLVMRNTAFDWAPASGDLRNIHLALPGLERVDLDVMSLEEQVDIDGEASIEEYSERPALVAVHYQALARLPSLLDLRLSGVCLDTD